jgi:elongator complex protein 2
VVRLTLLCFSFLSSHTHAHERIIWGVGWAHDSSMFATGSRDKTVKLWDPAAVEAAVAGAGAVQPLTTLPKLAESVTAVAWAPR